MQPAVRYARTTDGARVAFAEMGHGYPVIAFHVVNVWNVALDWDLPGAGDWHRAQANHYRLIRLDVRGQANSDEAPSGRKLSDYVPGDLDAVADALNLQSFALAAAAPFVQLALEYATSRPTRVSHLLLHNPLLRDQPWSSAEAREAHRHVVQFEADQAGVDLVKRDAWAWAQSRGLPSAARQYERIMRSNTSAKAEACWELVWDLHHELDPLSRARLISQPAMITSDSPFFDPMARELAASIGGAVCVLGCRDVEHRSATEEEREEHARRIARFLLGDDYRPAAAAGAGLKGLTPREREILSLVAAGHNNEEIAEALVLSPHTVARHIANVYAKLGIHNRAQAAAVALGGGQEGSATLQIT